jgi:hypothetical protein
LPQCGYSLPKRSQKNFSSKSVKDAEGISRLVQVQGARMLRRAAMRAVSGKTEPDVTEILALIEYSPWNFALE